LSSSLPWLAHYGSVPHTLEYPDGTIWDAVERTVHRIPDAVAYDFLGATATYAELGAAVERCAAGLAAAGLRHGDRITISMPTSPQGVIAVYAAARLGAIASLIHPLSTSAEIAGYLEKSGSRVALTLDVFHEKFEAAREGTPLEHLVLTGIADVLPAWKRAAFRLTRGRKLPRAPRDARALRWPEVMDAAGTAPAVPVGADDLAAILYSGGSTGAPKGIMLSHRNINAEGLELGAWVALDESDVVLAVLPIFHGFGLAALVHAPLMAGAKVVMVPQFSAAEVAKLIRTKAPTLMAGVPTLYDALSRDDSLRAADLSCLRAAFSGADTLPRPVKDRFEALVAERGGNVKLLEGYGLTEAVTAIMGSPMHEYREGSMGVPFPDTLAKVCAIGSVDEVEPGIDGEICISGPAVMLGYLDDPEATAATLRVHADGRTWLHTGDIGRMDEDGFFSFAARLKRMIKSSGFNVFPAEVESVLREHPAVEDACVVGVPDITQGERVAAFVVLSPGHAAGEDRAAQLIEHCRARLIKWSCPRTVTFLPELPRTRVGKVDVTELVARAAAADERRG
jgi:long-chain acyl-CoA synthetase